MDASELLETITQLIHQAEVGEIDPWDVQVIDVIDRFLELMANSATRGYESDLSSSGQAFLSASMLVLFKANTLTQLQAVEEVESDFDEFPDEENAFLRTQRLPLERALRRRSAAMPPSKRRVTLGELIEQLHIMAEQLKKVQFNKEVKLPVRTRNAGNNVRTMRQALELAHQENLTEVALELEQLLYRSASELSLDKEWVDLEKLVALWQNAKQPAKTLSGHHSPNSETVGVFWALLLLSAQSKVELYQEEFYTDVKIRLLTDVSTNRPIDAAS